MPIEVKELVVRTTVVDDSCGDTKQPMANDGSYSPSDKEAIIAECIDQVMKMIESKTER